MRRRGISETQRMALLWCGLLAPAAELLPTLLLPAAGRGAWLSVLAAALPAIAAGWLLDSLSGERGLAETLLTRFGPGMGRLLLLIYIVWAQLLLALRLRLCADRLLGAGERDGSLWFFLLALACAAWVIGRKSPPAFARAGQLFLAMLAVTGGAVLLLAAARVRPERLWPIGSAELGAALKKMPAAAGVLGWGTFAAFLGVERENRQPRRRAVWLAGGCAVLAAAQLVILGALGANLAAELDLPFFALTKSVGVEGVFRRVESVVAAVWIFSDLALMGGLLFALRAMCGALWPGVPGERVALGAVLAALALVPALFRQPGRAAEWNRLLVPAVGAVMGLILPFLLWIANRFLRRNGGKGTYCGKKRA